MAKPDTTNKAFLGAYYKGKEAALEGKLCISPYGVAKCRRRNGGAWNAVYRNYWQRGWQDGRKEFERRGLSSD